MPTIQLTKVLTHDVFANHLCLKYIVHICTNLRNYLVFKFSRVLLLMNMQSLFLPLGVLFFLSQFCYFMV